VKLALIFGTALCYCRNFEINDVDARYEDFGTKEDRRPDDADEHCCADMRFTADLPQQAILDKYKITFEEYNEIAEKLTEGLSFGQCGCCE